MKKRMITLALTLWTTAAFAGGGGFASDGERQVQLQSSLEQFEVDDVFNMTSKDGNTIDLKLKLSYPIQAIGLPDVYVYDLEINDDFVYLLRAPDDRITEYRIPTPEFFREIEIYAETLKNRFNLLNSALAYTFNNNKNFDHYDKVKDELRWLSEGFLNSFSSFPVAGLARYDFDYGTFNQFKQYINHLLSNYSDDERFQYAKRTLKSIDFTLAIQSEDVAMLNGLYEFTKLKDVYLQSKYVAKDSPQDFDFKTRATRIWKTYNYKAHICHKQKDKIVKDNPTCDLILDIEKRFDLQGK